MDDDGPARKAVLHVVAIAKAVYAGKCATNSVGIVPMGLESEAAKVCFHSFQLCFRGAYRPILKSHVSSFSAVAPSLTCTPRVPSRSPDNIFLRTAAVA